MKTIVKTFYLTLPILMFLGCVKPQDENVKEMLKITSTQNEIIETIINDQKMMTNLMSRLVKNHPAMKLLREYSEIVNQMPCSIESMKTDTVKAKIMMANMMELMESDTGICNMMGNMMIEHEHTMTMMMDLMDGNGDQKKWHQEMHHHHGMDK